MPIMLHFVRLLAVFSPLALFAQTFSFAPSVVDVPFDPNAMIGEANVKNLTNQQIKLRWKRSIVSLSPGCLTNVADPFNDYLPQVDSREFFLQEQEENKLYVYCFPEMITDSCCAQVRLRLSNTANSADSIVVNFWFNGGCLPVLPAPEALSIDARPKVWPNPVQDFFYLENAGKAERLRVFDARGYLVRTFSAAPAARYDLSELVPGTYFLKVERSAGTEILPFFKN